jgi:hypothetical protein
MAIGRGVRIVFRVERELRSQAKKSSPKGELLKQERLLVSAVCCLLCLRSSIFLQLKEDELLLSLRLFLLSAEREDVAPGDSLSFDDDVLLIRRVHYREHARCHVRIGWVFRAVVHRFPIEVDPMQAEARAQPP